MRHAPRNRIPFDPHEKYLIGNNLRPVIGAARESGIGFIHERNGSRP